MYKQMDVWICGLDGRVVWIEINGKKKKKGGNVWYGTGRAI
jgi:hypothetical protein